VVAEEVEALVDVDHTGFLRCQPEFPARHEGQVRTAIQPASSWRTLLRATPRQDPTGWHIDLKPGQAAGTRFGSQPIGPLKRYDQCRSESRNNKAALVGCLSGSHRSVSLRDFARPCVLPSGPWGEQQTRGRNDLREKPRRGRPAQQEFLRDRSCP
jgi:hypothetical protein